MEKSRGMLKWDGGYYKDRYYYPSYSTYLFVTYPESSGSVIKGKSMRYEDKFIDILRLHCNYIKDRINAVKSLRTCEKRSQCNGHTFALYKCKVIVQEFQAGTEAIGRVTLAIRISNTLTRSTALQSLHSKVYQLLNSVPDEICYGNQSFRMLQKGEV